MKKTKRKSQRPLKFILRLNKKERADLDQLSTVLMRSRNQAACIAIVYFAREIAKQENSSNLVLASTSILSDIPSGKRRTHGN
ncbi:MAG: hypothetical protein FJ031_04095 [Chloroflexi bacterium]|nr:hypothetical protein [Chloroflexota bacterium]